jgi:signal transduction histidine kinase
VAFGDGNDAEDLDASSSERSFYSLSLFFVVMLTFIGAFFLWRDTRRETRIAELRSQFVSSVSHELKTPLTSIRMFAETLQMSDEAGPGDPKMRGEYLDTIVNETERLTRLLNNVLDFSRIERGQKNYHMETALLPDVIDAALRTMRFPLAEQGFHLKLDVAGDIPAMPVDRDAIEQAVLNLLSNAMKYSGKNRDIELRLCRRNGSALIQVSDHGIGISADQQRRIFEKFYRVPTKENKAISGTGLGLALVAHIAEAHRGSVEVESTPGAGSTFSIRIPVNGNGGSGLS